MAKTATLNLEKSLQDLEKLVEKMESGEQDLEASLKLFEKGVGLVKNCQESLTKVERKVQILSENNKLIDFEEDA